MKTLSDMDLVSRVAGNPLVNRLPELHKLLSEHGITDDVKQNHRRVRNMSLRRKVKYNKELIRIMASSLATTLR